MPNEIPSDHQAVFDFGDCLALVNKVVTDDIDREIIAETHLRLNSATILAQFLMQNMSHPMHGDCDTFLGDEKVFWAKVAFEMGPDWIGKFHRIGAFMSAVDKA